MVIDGDREKTAARIEEHARHWQRELSGMTAPEIATALAKALAKVDAKGESWPPNPAEFRAMGKGETHSTPNAAMYRQAPKRLPRPPRSPEEIEAGRQALRQALKGGKIDA